ncbi:hypothetical protein GQ55_2G446700 [Panicum hallii var. hallii]|uniref:Uncharacterized protein n=1 Tax=Panicum hallii var. hallii TaxID=1504633 RepID=A0A2T7EZ43_9POAL|nr:hypothetical protein GQ55_2G446700 [Panicum hallii var. hallii]
MATLTVTSKWGVARPRPSCWSVPGLQPARYEQTKPTGVPHANPMHCSITARSWASPTCSVCSQQPGKKITALWFRELVLVGRLRVPAVEITGPI